MLDEIINYVQSLQRQVEVCMVHLQSLYWKFLFSHLIKAMDWPNGSPCFSQFLSMKLAAVNPQLGLNIKQLLSKDVSNNSPAVLPCSVFSLVLQETHTKTTKCVCVLNLVAWHAAFSHPQCSFKFIYSPGILILPRNDAQTTAIVAVGYALGKRSWLGQFRWVQNCHGGATKRQRLHQRACLSVSGSQVCIAESQHFY